MKKRKTLAMGLAVAMAVSCLAGCGGDEIVYGTAG